MWPKLISEIKQKLVDQNQQRQRPARTAAAKAQSLNNISGGSHWKKKFAMSEQSLTSITTVDDSNMGDYLLFKLAADPD